VGGEGRGAEASWGQRLLWPRGGRGWGVRLGGRGCYGQGVGGEGERVLGAEATTCEWGGPIEEAMEGMLAASWGMTLCAPTKVCLCTHAHTFTLTCACTHARTYAHTHTHTHARTHTYTHAHMYTSTHTAHTHLDAVRHVHLPVAQHDPVRAHHKVRKRIHAQIHAHIQATGARTRNHTHAHAHAP